MQVKLVRIETPKDTPVSDQTTGTIGLLIIGDKAIGFTLEPPDRNNGPDSCIPVGTYKCNPYNSDKYKNVWEITNVPNRSKILIHKGNSETDSLGCILVGKQVGYLDNNRAVLQSSVAYTEIFQILGNKSFELEITNL